MYLAEEFAHFAVDTKYEEISEEAKRKAKQCILDTLGVTLAGSVEPISKPVREYIDVVGGKPQSTIVGLGTKTSAPLAAFANGTFGHVHDYDDLTYIFIGHPSIVVIPAILALGEVLKSNGADIITAFLVGTEIQWKIGDAMVASGNHYTKGWHSTGPIGTLGAAAAAGKLLHLDSEKMAYAIGIAATEAAGIREQLGTMGKAFNAGRAAENGVVAAMLAERGFTSAKSALEGTMGFFHLMADEYDLNKVRDFGKPWGILEATTPRGHHFKLYPCCGSGDGSIDGMFSLVKEHDIKSEDVESVELFLHEKKVNTLKFHNPKTALEAKFSLEYWMAIALLDQQAGLKQFTDKKVQDPNVRKFMEKVTVVKDLSAPRFPIRIKVNMKDGQAFTTTYWPPKASPENPASNEELIAKYRTCADWYGLSTEKAEKSIKAILDLENLADIGELMKLMS